MDRLERLQTPDLRLQGVDWEAAEAFALSYPQRELLLVRNFASADEDLQPDAAHVNTIRLIGCAVKLRVGMTELASQARALAVIGVTCDFPPGPAPIEDPQDSDGVLVWRLLEATGTHLMSLVVENAGELDRVLGWMRWLWYDDPRLQRALAVASGLSGPFDEIAVTALDYLERIVAQPEGRIHRAHLVELAGRLGVSLTRLREALRPLGDTMASLDWTVPWFDDPLDTPPDWLDVGVVSLMVAWGDVSRWGEEVADFLEGNIEAPAQDIKRCWDRWSGGLEGDPNGLPTAPYRDKDQCTGMVAWTKRPAAK